MRQQYLCVPSWLNNVLHFSSPRRNLAKLNAPKTIPTSSPSLENRTRSNRTPKNSSEMEKPSSSQIQVKFNSSLDRFYYKPPTPNLLAFTGVTYAHGPSRQPTACRFLTCSLSTATGSNQDCGDSLDHLYENYKNIFIFKLAWLIQVQVDFSPIQWSMLWSSLVEGDEQLDCPNSQTTMELWHACVA